MTKIRLGTYNTNNLFDRFDDPYLRSDDPWLNRRKTISKSNQALYHLGVRIKESNVDILALQEVESLGFLQMFIFEHLGKENYDLTGIFSCESNDDRGIDLGVVCKKDFRLGKITSHRFRQERKREVFSRDCLQVEIIHNETERVILTLFICHQKSKYSRYHPIEQKKRFEKDLRKSTRKRKMQAKHTLQIIKDAGLDSRKDCFAVLGDMNDNPTSEAIQEYLKQTDELKLYNILDKIPAKPKEDYTLKGSLKRRARDTHRWIKNIEVGEGDRKQISEYSQLDYILLSEKLRKAAVRYDTNGQETDQYNVKVEQKKHTSGSDHYLSWVEIDLEKL
ncbi:MAG: endonuclease/exonuclease/phosphatase family protein [Candidatus Heimdallarchaeota archaeon]